jgi:acetyl esterase/lipase
VSQAQLASIIEGFRSLYGGWAAGTGIARMRKDWDDMFAQPRLHAEVTAVQANGVDCRWIAAPGAHADSAIVFFHGGGYQIGSLDSHRNVMARLSGYAGCRVLGVNYRLAPEHRFPAPVDDALAAYRWLLAQGAAPDRIALCGDSAGGGLAVALMTLLRDKHLPMPAAAVAMSPWVDMEAAGASFIAHADSDPVTQRQTILLMARAYLGRGGDPREPLASPIHANLARLPPLLVQAGSREVLLDDAKALVEAAKAQGVHAHLSVWPGMPHTFQLFAGRLDEADDAIREAAGFLTDAMTQDTRKQA